MAVARSFNNRRHNVGQRLCATVYYFKNYLAKLAALQLSILILVNETGIAHLNIGIVFHS